MDFTKTALAIGSAIGVQNLVKVVEGFGLNEALGVIGLERKPSTLSQLMPAVAIITVSAAVGAGIALLLAPSSGTQLRARLADGLDDAKHRLSDSISNLETTNRSNPRHAVS